MPSVAPRADGDRVARARAGDQSAWEEIVREIGPRIAGYARARGVPDPEDVMQDVFLAAARRIDRFEGDDDAFRSWLFAIAYRRIVDRHRKKRPTSPLPAELLDASPTPEDRAMATATVTDALAALEVLNTIERDVVLLRVIGDLDTASVAEAVGKRPGNVRVIQTRALAKVRTELERREHRRGGRQ